MKHTQAMELVSGILSNTAVQPDVVIYNAAISACVDSWLFVFHAVQLGSHCQTKNFLNSHAYSSETWATSLDDCS